jgi:hypothetical protein
MESLGFDQGYVKVTKLLYMMTRLGTAKKVTDQVEQLLKRKPMRLDDFIIENKEIWT